MLGCGFGKSPDGPLGIYLHKMLFDVEFFQGSQKLLQENRPERRGSEQEYTILFTRNLHWISRMLVVLTCDFQLEVRQILMGNLPKCKVLLLKNKFQSFE